MAIDLDAIVAGSNSVDDLVAALSQESASNAKASAQIMQLAGAGQGSLAPLEWLKSKISPGSTAGKLNTRQLYLKYVTDATSNGEAPISSEEFEKRLQDEANKANKANKGQG
jgi:hypothetical protein